MVCKTFRKKKKTCHQHPIGYNPPYLDVKLNLLTTQEVSSNVCYCLSCSIYLGRRNRNETHDDDFILYFFFTFYLQNLPRVWHFCFENIRVHKKKYFQLGRGHKVHFTMHMYRMRDLLSLILTHTIKQISLFQEKKSGTRFTSGNTRN